jgi:hypothetical protein
MLFDLQVMWNLGSQSISFVVQWSGECVLDALQQVCQQEYL